MARFNLAEYEDVKTRLARFYSDHPDGRVITENLTTLQDRQVSTWVVKTSVYFDWEELHRGTPKATGHAFEVDGGSGANSTSALENAETSSIGRALANAGYSGDRRASKEEMAKANTGVTPAAPSVDWLTKASDLLWKEDLEGLLSLYGDAVRLKAPADVIAKIKEMGSELRAKKDSAK
jgi:hypothetical protein